MELATREERRKLLMVRMHVAFETAFPNCPQDVIEEFCLAFFENRFTELPAHLKTFAKARTEAALIAIAHYEDGLTGATMGERIKKPMEDLIGLIVKEKTDLLASATEEFVQKRTILENELRFLMQRKSQYELEWRMHSILYRPPQHLELERTKTRIDNVNEQLTKLTMDYGKLSQEIRDRI